MRHLESLFLASTLLVGSVAAAKAEVNVVASIKPIHSLVAAVMDGIDEPGLIVDGAGSPHNWALKPSQAQMLESANIVFWVGHEMEAFLEKPLETVGANARSVALSEAHDLIQLEFREGGAFDDHGQEVHDHDKKQITKDSHDHEGDDQDHKKAAMDPHEGDGHGKFDAHIWLDPVNAKAIVHEIEEVLVEADPSNAAKYEANARAVMIKLDSLISEVTDTLKPVHDKGFVVFHDAYQYFENRFGLTASGSITVSPEVMPGAERIREIQGRVKELGATCVFAEPQFEPKLVSTVMEGTQAESGILDPLGAALDSGPDQYFQLIRNMATSVKACLSASS
jgi:zinc transport system substrate-binding protein